MKISQILTFIVIWVLIVSCFLINMEHNSLGRLGVYAFVSPAFLAIGCSLVITSIIFKAHPAIIGVVFLLCLFANLPPSAVGRGVNQDVIFSLLIVSLFLPTAKRWIDH